MTIGENIKKYRKQKGMTQRELADAIGVSVQAISKWECGATPDISQILPLAGALGASANELLGSAHHYEQLREKWYEMRNQYGEGSVELIEYEKSVLAEYPNDDYFGFALACEWDIRADECENENERLAYYRQAKKQYEENLKRKPDCEVNRSQLVCVCMKMGLKEEAMQYALQSSRKDVLLNHVYRGRELQEHKQRMIDRHLRHLIMEIRRSDNIESFRIGQNILRAVFPDGNCQRYYRHMVILGVHIAGKCMENQQRFLLVSEQDKLTNRDNLCLSQISLYPPIDSSQGNFY